MTADPVLERLLVLFRGKFGAQTQADDAFSSLDIDSLALAEISVAVEQEFRVRLTERVLEVNSIRELSQLIHELMLTPVSRR